MNLKEALTRPGKFVVSIGPESLAVYGKLDRWAVFVAGGELVDKPYHYEANELLFTLINFSLTDGGEA